MRKEKTDIKMQVSRVNRTSRLEFGSSVLIEDNMREQDFHAEAST